MVGSTLRILLIEDNAGDARLIRELLADDHGTTFELYWEQSLADGLERLERDAVDAILVDLGLPDSQGRETFLATRERAGQIAIIVLTGLDDEEAALWAVREGAQDYVAKGELPGLSLTRVLRYAIERKQAERALREGEERLQAVVRNAPINLFVLDQHGIVQLAEGAALRRLGTDPQGFVGRHASEVIGALGIDQDRPDVGDLVTRALAGEEAATTLRLGSAVFDTRLVPLRDAAGAVTGAIGVGTDVTERVGAQEELRKTLTELERRGEEMESFNYSVSHDLKEPLRTIEAFSKFVLEDYAGQVDEQGRDYLQRMGKAAARLKQMIEELLTLSRIGQRPEALHRVDISVVVSDIVAAMQIAIQEKHATIEVEEGLSPVLADDSRVEQIFGNLIANSLKFNQSEQPQITIGRSGLEAGMAVFFVRDNGIGIDEQYHDRIFQVFQRLHRREEYEGTGAGLAIVKRAVHALSGQIWLTSSPGEGATFFVALPAWRPEHAAIEQAQAEKGKAAVHAEV